MISDEAVEAAARILLQTSVNRFVEPHEKALNLCKAEVRPILAAAALYLKAKAWDGGMDATYDSTMPRMAPHPRIQPLREPNVSEDEFERLAGLLSRDNVPLVGDIETAGTIEDLPARMRQRRDAVGLSMRSVAIAVDVPMMTYRRFEQGECDRLRLPHIARMLRWLANEP